MLKALQVAQYRIASEHWRNFQNACWATDKGILAAISAASEQFEQSHAGMDAYLAGFVTELTGTIHLFKTENGWQEQL